jgi:hypothetical protein
VLLRPTSSKFTLYGKTLRETVERAVNRDHERHELAWQIMLGKPDRSVARSDCRRHFRDLADWFETSANRIFSSSQGDHHEEWNEPCGVDHKLAQERVRQEALPRGVRRTPKVVRPRLER